MIVRMATIGSSGPTGTFVDVNGVARDRMANEFLEYDGRASRALDIQVEHRPRVRQGQPQVTRVDLERDGVLAPAVHHPEDHPGASEPACRPRAAGLARLHRKGIGLGRCRHGWTMVASTSQSPQPPPKFRTSTPHAR